MINNFLQNRNNLSILFESFHCLIQKNQINQIIIWKDIHCWPLKSQQQEGVISLTSKLHTEKKRIWYVNKYYFSGLWRSSCNEAAEKRYLKWRTRKKVLQWIFRSKNTLYSQSLLRISGYASNNKKKCIPASVEIRWR